MNTNLSINKRARATLKITIQILAYLLSIAICSISFAKSAHTPLNKLAHQYFSSQGTDSKLTAKLTVQWLTDNQTQQKLFTLKQQLGINIDKQLSLTELLPYGLIPHQPLTIKNSYLINLGLHPLWADAQSLFQPLNTPSQLNQQWSLMLKFGFKNTELMKLNQYLTQYSQQQSQKLNQLILKHYIVNQGKQHNWNNIQTGKAYISYSKQISFNSTKEWARTLLAKFPVNTQQRLVDYLQQQLRFMIIAPAPISDEEFGQIGENIYKQHQQFMLCHVNSRKRIK